MQIVRKVELLFLSIASIVSSTEGLYGLKLAYNETVIKVTNSVNVFS